VRIAPGAAYGLPWRMGFTPSSVAVKTLALLAIAPGCCLEISVAVGASTSGSMASVVGSGTGRSGGGTSGGSSTGRAVALDAGTCEIDGGVFEAGTWQDVVYGSCAVCDPASSPTGWTVLDAGSVCEGMTYNSPESGTAQDTPVGSGRCALGPQLESPLSFGCLFSGPGGECGEEVGEESGCIGGFCSDAGRCEIDQNLGFATYCGGNFNQCAEGPCCLDAGTNGMALAGWCCGLIDGGVKTCLAVGQVCYDTTNCCDGLSCVGHDAVFGSTSYGFCR
jgi:hypothetical protein